MISKLRLVAISFLTMTALYAGSWAAFGPRSFYDSFPGLHRIWVGVDGPYNEHLIRDVGAMYLALAVGGVVVLILRGYRESLVLAAAWTAFSVPHLYYHLHHLGLYDTADQIGNVVALGGTLLISVALLVPPKRTASAVRAD